MSVAHEHAFALRPVERCEHDDGQAHEHANAPREQVSLAFPGWGPLYRRQDAIAATLALYVAVLDVIALTHADARIRSLAAKWSYRMIACGHEVRAFYCARHGTTKTVCRCCKTPPCPRQQRRYAQTWVYRAVALAEGKGALVLPKGVSWKLIVVSAKQTGDLRVDVENAIKLRADLARELRESYGMLAAFGAIEDGLDDGRHNIHVNMLVACAFVPRAALQSWLRSRDCTVPGCPHPADDRCDDCKAAKRACTHPEPEPGSLPDPAHDRARCDGSWYVDVRRAYRKNAKGQRPPKGERPASIADAVREAVKYATKPVDARGLGGDGPADVLVRANAGRAMLFHLYLAGRHRVETYGAARPRAAGEEHAADDHEPTENGSAPCCTSCLREGRGLEGSRMQSGGLLVRSVDGKRYSWSAPSSRAGP